MAKNCANPAPPPNRLITLFCWVLDVSTRSFPVDLEDDRTVGHLKEEIVKKKPVTFTDVDADELILWEVSITINQQLENEVTNLKHQFLNESPLLEGALLSNIFPPPGPAQKTLHIVIVRPIARSLGRPHKRVRLASPHTPIRSQATSPETKVSPSRLARQEFLPSMSAALLPFTQYITDLANGKLDSYFNSTQPGTSTTELSKGPILLLHSLGNYPDDARLKKLFKPDTVHLFAVSGSGKTRLSLEGLCHEWGLYISCRDSSTEGAAGSSDFACAMEIMESMSNWDQSTGGAANSNHNVDVAHRAFAMLICARVFVLKCLLEKLPSDTDAVTARRRWVLVQVMPPSNGTDDIFVNVLQILRAADKGDMIECTKSMLTGMTKMVGPNIFPKWRLFVVVDEVQFAAEYLNGSFRSAVTGTDKRPALHPFYSFLWKTNIVKGIILAGTGLSMTMVQTSVSSQSAKRQNYRQRPIVFVEVGQFTKDGTDHKAYIEKYLLFAANVSDQRLMERILYWFRGRYRFTATLIELLLSTQSRSRHRILSAVVYSLTGFTLTDAIDLEEEEPDLTDATRNQLRYCKQVAEADHLFEKAGAEVVKYIFHAVMRWRIGSQTTPILINVDVHQIITAGIGHLQQVGPDQTFDTTTKYPVYLCEPLVVLYLSTVFSVRKDTTIKAWIADAARIAPNNLSLGFVLEEAVLLVLLQTFGNEARALSDAFDTDQPWGSRKVTLVSLKRRTDGQMQSCPVSWTSGSSDRLGYKATSSEDVIKFLNNPDGKCFLFPDNHMGPDLSCFFQDVETKELILLVLQIKLSKILKAEICLRALESVNPEFFYTKTKDGNQVQYGPSKYPDLLKDVMKALDLKLGSPEYEPLVDNFCQRLQSFTKINEKFVSQPQRQTPRYLRIIATRDKQCAERFKADSTGAVGVLRWELVEQLFGDVMWDSSPSVT